MDLIKEWNGFVYGCISRGGARGAAAARAPLLGLLELRLGIRIRIRLSPLTLTGTRTHTRGANALDS